MDFCFILRTRGDLWPPFGTIYQVLRPPVSPGFRCKVADCLIHMYYTNRITLSIILNGLVLDDFIIKLYGLLIHPAH
jgi:hypothetical protein